MNNGKCKLWKQYKHNLGNWKSGCLKQMKNMEGITTRHDMLNVKNRLSQLVSVCCSFSGTIKGQSLSLFICGFSTSPDKRQGVQT